MEAGFRAYDVVPRPAMTCQYRRGDLPAVGDVFRRHRAQAVTAAGGRVLELGASDVGDLLPYRRVGFLALVQPSEAVRAQQADLNVPAVQVTDARLERLPFPACVFDVAICTFSLCTADRPDYALLEIGRVLRSSGRMVFLEHTRGPGAIGRTQDRIEAMLRGSGRCRPNLEVVDALQAARFVLRDVSLSWPAALPSLHAPLVQGVAAHPDTRHERELHWLDGG
jgi:SAM-dependent methyltransferase